MNYKLRKEKKREESGSYVGTTSLGGRDEILYVGTTLLGGRGGITHPGRCCSLFISQYGKVEVSVRETYLVEKMMAEKTKFGSETLLPSSFIRQSTSD